MSNVIFVLQQNSEYALRNQQYSRRVMLNTILSDLQEDGKYPPEAEMPKAVLKLVSKYRRAIKEGAQLQDYVTELEKFLPPLLSEEELREIVKTNGLTNMGSAMAWFREYKPEASFEPSLLRDVISKLPT